VKLSVKELLSGSRAKPTTIVCRSGAGSTTGGICRKPTATWLPGSGCVETHETWLEDKRYLNMSLLAQLDARSYDALLCALEARYTDVIWYRGSANAWKAANLDLAEPARIIRSRRTAESCIPALDRFQYTIRGVG
jgi:hypothetical protein